jgi:hypothetical protein
MIFSAIVTPLVSPLLYQSINSGTVTTDSKTPDLHEWDDRNAKQEGGGSQSSDPDSSDWAVDLDDDEPVNDPSDDTDAAVTVLHDTPTPMVQQGAVEDHMVEAVNAIDEADQEPQNAAFAAAIRWALRARNLDLNGGNAGIGGGAEEIDEADDGIGLNLIGDRVDQDMDRARELIAEADRRIRQAEGHARLGPEGVFMGVRMGANSGRGSIDRRTRRRDKIISKEKLQGDRRCAYASTLLPLHTPLNAELHPKDFIAAVVIDTVLSEVASILDGLAVDMVPFYHSARKLGKPVPPFMIGEIPCARSSLASRALEIVRVVVRSPYRKLLVTSVFRILLVHCGLRVKWAAAEALSRYFYSHAV